MKTKEEIESMKKKIADYGRQKNLRYPVGREVLCNFVMAIDWVLGQDGYMEEGFSKMVDDLGETK